MAEAMDIDDLSNADENANPVEPSKVFSPKQKKRLDFLLNQAEIFSHFLDHSPKKGTKRKIHSKQPKRRTNRDQTDDVDNEGQTLGVRFDITPAYIQGEMRDYQLRGLNWMISLYETNINGILADEMGLGKTLQTISILGFLKNYENINGPFLVVGPKSTLRNWYNEVTRFCSSLKPVILIGDRGARSQILEDMKHADSWNVCLTTYEMCLSESGALKRYKWQYLVVDEAHRLKNENSQLAKTLRTFTSYNRLLLTGTPLQNNLHELWALLNFLLPDIFSSSDDFDTWFDSDDCLRGNNDVVHRLRAILQPFMLRRMKADVEKTLLPKIEVKLFVGMTTLQRETYKKVLVKDVIRLNSMGEQSAKSIQNVVMELRKASNHPYLIENVEPGPPFTTDQHLIDSCGKMMVLDKLLTKIKLNGSRVVMFSQFQIMLDILEDFLMFRKHEYRRLDGSTSYEDRAQSIDDYNAENSSIFVFLISTRAGGLGINLTTADTVVLYDSDWNPQPDFQAIDRVHRIGQKKQVRVFRLVTENSIDERIVQRAEIKTRLDNMIIQHGRNVDQNLNAMCKGTKSDIMFGAEHIMGPGGSDVIDIDIDKILKQGELKTAEENMEYAKLGESELRHLTLEDASSVSVYNFEGIDFRDISGTSKDGTIPSNDRRPRKAVQYYMQSLVKENKPETVPVKMKYLNDYQFYPTALINRSENRWINLAVDKEQNMALLEQGFPKWHKIDVKKFCDAMAEFGRDDFVNIASKLPEKTLEDVIRYHSAFWARGPKEMKDFDRFIFAIMKKELQKSKDVSIAVAFQWKMAEYRNPIFEFNVSHRNSKLLYTTKHDAFLMCQLQKYGIDNPTAYVRIRNDILNTSTFRFDWFFRSRNAAELEKHIKYLLTLINNEYHNISKNPDNVAAGGSQEVS